MLRIHNEQRDGTYREHNRNYEQGIDVELYAMSFYPNAIKSTGYYAHYDFRIGDVTIDVKSTRSDRWSIDGSILADCYLFYFIENNIPILENILFREEVERLPIDSKYGYNRRILFRQRKSDYYGIYGNRKRPRAQR